MDGNIYVSSGASTNRVAIAGENKFTVAAVSTLMGAWLIQLVCGSAMAMGSLIVYMVSYFRIVRKYNVNEDSFFPLLPMIVTIASIAFPVANHMIDNRFDGRSRPVCAIFSFVGLALIFSCLHELYSPNVFLVVYTLGFGIMKGGVEACVLRAGWSHLPKRKGLVSGIIISGHGFGGAVFSMLFEEITNPGDIEPIVDKHDGNLYFPAEIGSRYPEM